MGNVFVAGVEVSNHHLFDGSVITVIMCYLVQILGNVEDYVGLVSWQKSR